MISERFDLGFMLPVIRINMKFGILVQTRGGFNVSSNNQRKRYLFLGGELCFKRG